MRAVVRLDQINLYSVFKRMFPAQTICVNLSKIVNDSEDRRALRSQFSFFFMLCLISQAFCFFFGFALILPIKLSSRNFND